MKNKLLVLLIALPFILGAGAIIKSKKEGESIEFWTQETAGSYSKKAEITDDGTLKVDTITNVAGTNSPVGGVPAGTIVAFGGSSVPTGWFLCNGATKTEATYVALFAAIGTAWNTAAKQDSAGGNYSAPPAGTFRLPDLRGTHLRGVGTSSRTDGSGDQTIALAGFRNDSTAVNGLTSSHDHASFDASINPPNYNVSNRSGGTFSTASHQHVSPNGWGASVLRVITDYGTTTKLADNHYYGYVGQTTVSANTALTMALVSTAINGSGTASTSIDHDHAAFNNAINVPSMSSTLGGNTETGVRATGVNYIIKY